MKKIAILGHFAKNHISVGGQTQKTKSLSQALSTSGRAELTEIDTFKWYRHPLKLVLEISKAIKRCDAVIMLPAQKGVQVFSYLLSVLNARKGKKLYYDVIGAWLPKLLSSKPGLAKVLKKFDGIWCETNTMKIALEKMNFENVTVVPNFKDIQPIGEEEINNIEELPVRLAIFSRLSEAKGVTDAIEAVKSVNKQEIKYILDIYGPVEETYADKFDNLVEENSSFVKYGGVIASEESVETLKHYHALLFPTRYCTEGIPGTIIDAYCAGLPIISARWESYADICIEGKTAISYEIHNTKELKQLLEQVSNDVDIINRMKKEALSHGKQYTLVEVQKQIYTLIGV